MTEQAYLQDNPAKASKCFCVTCHYRIGDSEYIVDAEGIVKHWDCFRHALTLIKGEIIPIDRDQNIVSDRNSNLHAAVQIIVTIARQHGLLLEHGGR